MRPVPMSIPTLCTLVAGLAVPLTAQQGPCAQITAACKNAGFTLGGASTGTGLQADCVIPVMQGIAQPAAAARPLPQIDPQVVAACKASHPSFGQGKALTATATADIGPAPASAAGPLANPASPSASGLAATSGNGITPPSSSLTAGAGSLQPGVPSGQGGQPDVEPASRTPSPSTVTKLNGGIRSLPLTCRIGQMNSGYLWGNGAGDVAFFSSTGPASGVQAGECAFEDRAVKASEPHALCVDASLSEVKLDSGGIKIISFQGAGAQILNSVADGPTRLMNFMVHLNAPTHAACWIIDRYGP
jgi:hypothetical protein